MTYRLKFLRLCGMVGIGMCVGCPANSGENSLLSDGQTEVASAATDQTPTETRTPIPTETDRRSTQQIKLTPNDGDSTDFFGVSIAASSDGTTALIGAYRDEDPNGENAGSAYVFEISGESWVQELKLIPNDGDA